MHNWLGPETTTHFQRSATTRTRSQHPAREGVPSSESGRGASRDLVSSWREAILPLCSRRSRVAAASSANPPALSGSHCPGGPLDPEHHDGHGGRSRTTFGSLLCRSIAVGILSRQSIRGPFTLLPGRGHFASERLIDSSFYAMAVDTWSLEAVTAVGGV